MQDVTSTTLPTLNLGAARGEAAYAQMSLVAGGLQGGESAKQIREHVGEFVGTVFYGTLMRQMEDSSIKGKYGHGGRGEEIFQGQLNMELAKRMGRSPNDPIANCMYESIMRHLGKGEQLDTAAGTAATAENAASETKGRRQA